MLATSVGGLPLDCCVYNASGPRTGSVEALSRIGSSAAGAVLSKSCTLARQDGNPLPRAVSDLPLGEGRCGGSFNSEGLPNLGVDYYTCKETVEALAQFGKPYIVSLSGLSLEDNLVMLARAMDSPGVSAVELNLACPNIPGKPIIAYDFEEMDRVLAAVTSLPCAGNKPLGVKLAPYFDVPHFDLAAEILAKHPIRFVTTTNTIGNALFVDADNECSVIAPKGGLGGLGGGFIKHTALANVRLLSQKLAERGRADLSVVGVGGVSSGRDAFELILCGASAVQVGSCYWTEGPGCFARIAEELRVLMEAKGYRSIEDFRGKLKAHTRSSASRRKTEVPRREGAASGEPAKDWTSVLLAVIAALVAIIAYLLLGGGGLGCRV